MSLVAADLGTTFSPRLGPPLLPLVAAGDDGAMRQLTRRFTPFVRSVARRMGTTAASLDDVVQETMLRLWRSAGRFDPDRGTEPTFVATVARNTAIDLARRQACRPAVASAELQEADLAGDTEADHLAAGVATTMTVRAALAALPASQRELLRLAYFEQLTQQQIAARLGLPIGTVKSRTFHAFRTLRTILGEDVLAAA